MRYDAILFDLDGTLTASAPGIFSSVRYAVDKMGLAPLDDETLRGFVGPSLHYSMQAFCGMDEEGATQAVALYREYYAVKGIYDAAVYTGIPNLLRSLKAEGIYLAIATSKPTTSARIVLDHFGLTRFFDRIIGAEPGRTETDKSSLIRDALPARFTRAAMVGDRRFDMAAAKTVGIDAIGAGWGYGTPEELNEAGADAVAADVDEAARLLLSRKPDPVPGFFISVEGLDGSGKTTQMNAIASHMRARGYDVLETREPGGTPISEDIRHLVLSPEKTMCAQTEALLYAAARAQHVQDVIRPATAAGRVVLCDRFVDSSIAYQGAGRELGLQPVAAINAFATQGLEPDLTVLLVVPAQMAFLRREGATELDRLERSGEAFFGRVYEAYATLAHMHPERIRCVDAQQDIDTVRAEACMLVDRLLATR